MGPDSVAPLAITASCTRFPYIPAPPKAGRSAGCTLTMRPAYFCTTPGGTSFR